MVSCCACAAAEAGSWRASAAAVTWACRWKWLWCLVWSEIHLSTWGGKYMYTWIHALQYSWHGGRRVTYWLVIIMQLSECNMHNLLKVAIIEYTHTHISKRTYTDGVHVTFMYTARHHVHLTEENTWIAGRKIVRHQHKSFSIHCAVMNRWRLLHWFRKWWFVCHFVSRCTYARLTWQWWYRCYHTCSNTCTNKISQG